jgi:2'-5' RNA ligase
VTHLKTVVKKIIGHSFESFHSIAHLTLFQYFDFHNESKLYEYEEIVSRVKQFEISLRNFNAFDRSGTIYLDIEKTDDVCYLANLLGHRITPHITIAKNLSKQDFDRAWNEFKKRTYSCRFICKDVKVLKRSSNKWVEHTYLPLRK